MIKQRQITRDKALDSEYQSFENKISAVDADNDKIHTDFFEKREKDYADCYISSDLVINNGGSIIEPAKIKKLLPQVQIKALKYLGPLTLLQTDTEYIEKPKVLKSGQHWIPLMQIKPLSSIKLQKVVKNILTQSEPTTLLARVN